MARPRVFVTPKGSFYKQGERTKSSPINRLPPRRRLCLFAFRPFRSSFPLYLGPLATRFGFVLNIVRLSERPNLLTSVYQSNKPSLHTLNGRCPLPVLSCPALINQSLYVCRGSQPTQNCSLSLPPRRPAPNTTNVYAHVYSFSSINHITQSVHPSSSHGSRKELYR